MCKRGVSLIPYAVYCILLFSIPPILEKIYKVSQKYMRHTKIRIFWSMLISHLIVSDLGKVGDTN